MPLWCGHGQFYLYLFAFKFLAGYSFITLRCVGATCDCFHGLVFSDSTMNYAYFGVLLTSRIISLPTTELHLDEVTIRKVRVPFPAATLEPLNLQCVYCRMGFEPIALLHLCLCLLTSCSLHSLMLSDRHAF